MVGYTARHARRARCASRARTRMSSPCVARVIAVFCPPRTRPARALCGGGGACSIARTRCGVGIGGGGGGRLHHAPRTPHVTRVRAHVIKAHRIKNGRASTGAPSSSSSTSTSRVATRRRRLRLSPQAVAVRTRTATIGSFKATPGASATVTGTTPALVLFTATR